VLRAVLLAALATAVLPPAGAWWLNSRRVDITTERVRLAAGLAAAPTGDVMLCGPGRLPNSSAKGAGAVHAEWLASAAIDPGAEASGRLADAWGQCLLVGRGWVLSAGANGIIETPIGATTTQGDDSGVRLR